MRLVHLVTGPDGQSHVREESCRLDGWEQATGIRFEETPAGSALAWHVAPRRQYVLTLSGRLEFTTHGGETFVLAPGDVLLAEDTAGGGHDWRIVGPDPWRRAYVSLDPVPLDPTPLDPTPLDPSGPEEPT